MAHIDDTNPSTGETTWVNSRYEKLREHARGGMGQVWVALDREFNREVAFKEIRDQKADANAIRTGFVLEAEVTGQLEHPGIVPVYSLGKDSTGRPYYAMRFIRGTNLAEQVARFHSKEFGPRTPAERSLQLRELLDRFRDVCDAIDYAHSRAVVHRDLKPANIMIGRFGETLVVDWGLAKLSGEVPEGAAQEAVRSSATDDMDQTMAGSAKGTPSYMSPEQAGGRLGQIGPATDIYGLGATLYHVLTGRPPVDGEDTGEVLRKVERGEFPPPRSIDSGISRGLEAICLKAMALKPADRYQSAGDLGGDLRRWLADEAISCYTDPPLKRLARLYRHHRRKANAAALALVALSVVGAAWFLFLRYQHEQVRLQAERLVARGEDALAADRVEDAVNQLSEAMTLLRGHTDLIGLQGRAERDHARAEAALRLKKFLAQSDDAEEQILGSLWTLMPHEEGWRKRRIRRKAEQSSDLQTGIARAREASALYGLPDTTQTVREPAHLDPERASRLRSRAGETIFLLALAEERVSQGAAAAQQATAREQACRLLDIAEDLGNRSWSLYRYRARFRDLLGRKAQADDDRRRTDKTPLSTFLDHHLKGVELGREQKKPSEASTEFRIALAARPGDYWTLFRLAKTLESLKQIPQAESLFRMIVALRPDDPTTHNTLGTHLSDQGKNEEGIAEFKAVLRARPEYLMAYGNMMKAQGDLKQVDAAEATFRQLMNQNPDAIEQSRGWNFLGIAYERVKRDNEALTKYNEAIRLDPENEGALRNRSLCLARLRRYAEALDDIGRAIELEPKDGDLRFVKGLLLSSWGRDPAAARDRDEATRRIDESIVAYGEAVRLGHGSARYNRAVMLRQRGRFPEAIQDHDALLKAAPDDAYARYERAMNRIHLKAFRDAIDDLDRVVILDTPRALSLRSEAYRTRGKVWGDLGTADDLKRSEADLDRAIEMDPKEPDGYRSRGRTRMLRGESADAATPPTDSQAESCRGGIADYRKYLELRPAAPDAPSILNDISTAYQKLGRLDEALEALDQAVQREANPSHYSNRGNFHLKEGDLEKAIADFDAAIRLDPKHTRAWALRGQARMRQGRFDDAGSDLDRALELEPGVYETLVLRSFANLGGKRLDATRRDLEVVARDRPNHVRGKASRGLLHYLDRRFPEALVSLSAGMEDPVLRPFLRPYRARAFLGLGTQGVSAAAVDADELSRELPLDGFALLEAARIHATADRPEGRNRAFDLLSQAVQRQPELRDRLGSDHDLRPLQTDGRFAKLLEKP